MKTIHLTQEPYITGTAKPLPWGTYNGSWYEASAVDDDGEEYLVMWEIIDPDVEDESEACDWKNPYYVQRDGYSEPVPCIIAENEYNAMEIIYNGEAD